MVVVGPGSIANHAVKAAQVVSYAPGGSDSSRLLGRATSADLVEQALGRVTPRGYLRF